MINCNAKFMTLDIETSSLMGETENKDGEKVVHPLAVWLSYGVAKIYSFKGVDIEKIRFREWHELHHFLAKTSQALGKFQMICYVHNLGYEFDYLIKNISKPLKFLTNSTHSPISSTLVLYPNIQFRCSYLLSGYSLAKIGDIVNLPKLDSDYRQIFPDDIVTEQEWEYCERDNDVVAKYITDICLKEYSTLFDIPYTKTGRVRRVFRKWYDIYEGKTCKWDEMPPENCIEAMEKSFNGGIVISNPFFTDLPLKNVHSFDIKSSYPFAALSEQYPRKIIKYDTPPKRLLKGDYYIAKVRFKNIRQKYNWIWLSISKMENINDCNFFNGKLMYGKSCDRYVTNVDFELIRQTYDFDYEVIEFYQLYEVDTLPKCFIDTIKEIGVKKEQLKIVLDELEEGSDEYYETSIDYTLAKNDFNSIYGMMVEKLIKDEYYIDENYLWHTKKGAYKYVEHMKRNFLFGIFITAYARKNLLTAIITNCPETFVYADTDSIKFIGDIQFIDTNKQLPTFMDDTPTLSKLGRFCDEGVYIDFKTLGAKKYCYSKVNKQGIKQYYFVVAGLPKNTEYNINTIDDFKCGNVYKNCKLGKTYLTQTSYFEIDEDMNVECSGDTNVAEWLNDNNIDTFGGVGLYPTSYKLDMTDIDKIIVLDYRRLLNEWLNVLQQKNGIQLEKFFHMNVLTV